MGAGPDSGRQRRGSGGEAKHDLYYIKNPSLWLDLVILAETVKTVLRQRGPMTSGMSARPTGRR